jgi:P4 family phage/plasmid primase-like protien
VAFANCFVRVAEGTIIQEPHSPANRCRRAHPFPYDVSAPRWRLDAFFEQVFADASEDERAARIALLQEFAGACLVGVATDYQVCALLLGPGCNGKGAVLTVLRSSLPDGTAVALAPQHWPERFQLTRLVGALGNFVDELPNRDFVEAGKFKAVVGGEPVHIDVKHRDPFEARIRAGHVFAANNLPETRDLSDGFFRRFIICEFGRSFETAAERRLKEGEAVVAACRPGIVAWALEGAARLQRQGRYTVPESSAEIMRGWRVSVDSVASFVEARTEPDPERQRSTPARALYNEYRDWSRSSGFTPLNVKQFAQRMKNLRLASFRRGPGRFYPVALLPAAYPGSEG